MKSVLYAAAISLAVLAVVVNTVGLDKLKFTKSA